jgi:hypothetical protein
MSTQLPFSWPRVLAKCCRLSAGGRRVRVQISPPDYAEVSPMHEIPSARRLVVAPSSPQPKSPSAPASDSYLNSPRSLKAGPALERQRRDLISGSGPDGGGYARGTNWRKERHDDHQLCGARG